MNPITILSEKNQEVVRFILAMLDGKSIGEICDILDVVNYYLNSSNILCDDEIFCVDKLRRIS